MTESERYESLPHCNYADVSGAGNDVYEFVKMVGKYVLRNLDSGYSRKELGVSYVKEKRLRVNRRLKTLQEKVREHQERIQTVAKSAGMNRTEWVENADRWVAGFLEMFEEGCHKIGTAIRDGIRESLRSQMSGDSTYLLQNGKIYFDDDEDDDDDEDGDEFYDDGDDDLEYYD